MVAQCFRVVPIGEVKVQLLDRIKFSLPPCPNRNVTLINVADVTPQT
jgi:hypothetical protein